MAKIFSILRKIGLILLCLFIILGLPIILYIKTFDLINFLNPNIFYRVASDFKSDQNIFLNRDDWSDDGTFEVYFSILDFKEISTWRDVARIVYENKGSLQYYFETDAGANIKNFIHRKGYTIEGYFDWMHRFSLIDLNIMRLSLFLSYFILFWVLRIKNRFLSYLVSCGLYFLMTMVTLSGGILLPIIKEMLINFFNAFSTYGTTNSYEYLASIMPSVIEAMVTLSMFDALYMLYKDSRDNDKKNEWNYLANSLNVLINYLEFLPSSQTLFRIKLELPWDLFLNECEKVKRRMRRGTKKSKVQVEFVACSKVDDIDTLERLVKELRNHESVYQVKDLLYKLQSIKKMMKL